MILSLSRLSSRYVRGPPLVRGGRVAADCGSTSPRITHTLQPILP
jgi:hypothetical protein